MGKKGGWFSAVRKALIPDHKEKKDQRPHKSKKRWLGRHSRTYEVPCDTGGGLAIAIPPSPPSPLPSHRLAYGDLKLNHLEIERNRHAYSLVLATAGAVAAVAAEVVRLTSFSYFSFKSREITAAVKIQTAFRAYTARRASRPPGGMVRLKDLMEGGSVKRQTAKALQYTQTLARVQSQIRARRIRMSEQNRALGKQLEYRREKELVKLKLGVEWKDSKRSKEQMEKRLQNRHEASIRRERALAYALSHQPTLKKSRSSDSSLTDPNNPTWGWSWLERWMGARPWETRSINDYNNRAAIKSVNSRAMSTGEATRRSYSNRRSSAGPNNTRRPLVSSYWTFTHAEGLKQQPRSPSSPSSASNCSAGDDDTKSVFSIRSEKPHFRRHSIAGSLMPTSTNSPKAAAKFQFYRNGPAFEKGSVMAGHTAKKSLSFQGSPSGPRRLHGPPKVENWSISKGLGGFLKRNM
ncbi:hypothetical protein SAY86_027228 [Trapa natans]|uniref:Uncharacterized protein n=1 Tax=Trapa natans TaxID=22666 RepID=A0AAN7KH54_TRANT|nr:hypothetical protein SAY86_027228 [Trapa natans]